MIDQLNRPKSSPPTGPLQPETAPPLRIVTAGSLFDGHDAAINLMRRLMQASGAEVIHLGHDPPCRTSWRRPSKRTPRPWP